MTLFLLQLALYSEAPATSGLTQAQVEAWQAERGIAVAGCATRPVLQFAHAGEPISVHSDRHEAVCPRLRQNWDLQATWGMSALPAMQCALRQDCMRANLQCCDACLPALQGLSFPAGAVSCFRTQVSKFRHPVEKSEGCTAKVQMA